MNLTPEERDIGKENFHAAIGSDLTRRDFLKGSLVAATGATVGLGSFYFGYAASLGDPVRVGVIGTGDEGGVLIGAHTPEFVQIKAIADIRPYNIHRAFHGDHSSAEALAARTGLMSKYGWTSEDEARKHVKVYADDYNDLLRDPDIDAVIIALPLHLHAPVAIEAMKAGKHVLTEKLMAHNIAQCKDMSRVALSTGKLLATGHQRHYSILYDNAVDTIRRGLLGDLHHIRAQWHRGNLPGSDSWQQPLPDKDMAEELAKLETKLSTAKGKAIDDLQKDIELLKLRLLDQSVDAAKYGYLSKHKSNGELLYDPMGELIRWRLWARTGGGLMAELGSHQLDASGIFVSSLRNDGEKARPLTVQAAGGRHIFPEDRECEDHVYCTYEYPGPEYANDPNKKIVVTYSSINGNGFGGYGEVVYGTEGTLILEREQEVMLFKKSSTSTRVQVNKPAGGKSVLGTTDSGGGSAAGLGKQALESKPISRGYTEEIEHWAWCIRNPDPNNLPHCHPKVAMADAIIALTTNIAIRENRRIKFEDAWFKPLDDATPDGSVPTVKSDGLA